MSPNYAIVLDSISDFPVKLQKKFKVPVVPAHVIIGEEDFLDKIDITHDKIVHDLEHSNLKITTTQPSPIDFHEVFEKTLEDYDEILYLGISTGLSATFQNATIAAKKISKEKITCLHTVSVSHGTSLMGYHACLLRENGATLKEVVEEVKLMIDNTEIVFLVETLKYLQRGGRIGLAKGLLGTLLNKKPILHLVDGQIDTLETVTGIDAGLKFLRGTIIDYAKKYENFSLVGSCGLANPVFEEIANSVKAETNPLFYYYDTIGPAVLCHVGPNIEAFMISKIPDKSVDLYK